MNLVHYQQKEMKTAKVYMHNQVGRNTDRR